MLRALGELLTDRGASVEAVAIGGGSLLLLGLIRRPTRDLDLVALVDQSGRLHTAQPLPAVLQAAVEDIARPHRLDPHWLNAAPTSLIDLGLPEGLVERAERREYGGLVLHLATRRDQIALNPSDAFREVLVQALAHFGVADDGSF